MTETEVLGVVVESLASSALGLALDLIAEPRAP